MNYRFALISAMIFFLDACKTKSQVVSAYHMTLEVILIAWIVELQFPNKSYMEQAGIISIIAIPIGFLSGFIPDLIADWLKVK